MEEEILLNRERAEKFEKSALMNTIKNRGVSIKMEGRKVIIEGDPIEIMLTKEVIIAFNRGFEEGYAELLFDPEYSLHVIDVSSYSSNKERIKKLEGRVIGKGGSIKSKIEKMTNTKISVFGKTISIIGSYDEVDKARRIIDSILRGRSFSSAFHALSYG